MKSSSSMSKFCCITDLIRFMMKEEENLMKGSVNEDDFFIIHDALVLMTAKETIQWTKEKNYYHHWLLPMNGLQDGTPYAGRPLPLVRAPPQLTLFPSPTTFCLCSFLSVSPSNEAPFARYNISNAFSAEEGVPIFDSHIRFIPWAISLGVEKLKLIFLSSSSVPSPSSTKRLKTQWKRKQ